MDGRLQELYDWVKEEKQQAGLVKKSQESDHEYYLGKWSALDDVLQKLIFLFQSDFKPNED